MTDVRRKFVLFALVLFVDFCTKYWVVQSLPIIQPSLGYPFGGIGILQSKFLTISIVHTTNTGAAWSLFASSQIPLLIMRMIVTLALLVWVFAFQPRRVLGFPLALIAAGACGNIVDFFHYGHVIDMIYCIFYNYSFPIFNVADSVIFCSVLFLLISSFRKKQGSHHHAASS